MGHSLVPCAEYLRCVFKKNEVLLRLLSPAVWLTPGLEPLAVSSERKKLHKALVCYLEARMTKASV